MRKIIATILMTTLLATVAVAMTGATAAPLSTSELKQTIGSGGKNTLIFFQNPHGVPCKIQKEVLDKLQAERKANFNIASVSTTRQEDQKAFYDYGIRSLPSLVLVDRNGKIARVFPPGIQSGETLASALNGLK